MTSSNHFDHLPMLVVALGGNALSPASGEASYSVERELVEQTCLELKALIDRGYRLLIVHGNGPQVGRLMRNDIEGENLDICVAQTQGELGYLLVQGLYRQGVTNCVSLMTRTVVSATDPALSIPDKPVGPVLHVRPRGPSRRVNEDWRALVGSPSPVRTIEQPALRMLLTDHHVIAAGGGGVAVTAQGQPVQGVVDKDRIAAQLAIAFDASELLFITDVAGLFDAFGTPAQTLVRDLCVAQVHDLLKHGSLGGGSMAPKLESAAAYSAACGRPARIVALGSALAGMNGHGGTVVTP